MEQIGVLRKKILRRKTAIKNCIWKMDRKHLSSQRLNSTSENR